MKVTEKIRLSSHWMVQYTYINGEKEGKDSAFAHSAPNVILISI